VSRHVFLPAWALLLLSGCAGNEAVVKKPLAPATSATPVPQSASAPAPRPAAPAPTETLRPEVPAAEEQRLLESTRQNITDVARTLGDLEGRPLKPPQQETLRTAKNFLDQARSALDQKDYQRAANLASKARALTDDLAGAAK
jgi:hypothetical protein